MDRKSHISMGPGAASLILIFVMLSASVLAMLTMMNSRNDRLLSERSAQVAEAVYALNASAEESRAELSGYLIGKRLSEAAEMPDERFTAEGDTIAWTEADGSRTLSLRVHLDSDSDGIIQKLSWISHRLTADIGNVEEEWD